MEIVISIAKWLFLNSIYGVFVVGFAAYAIALGLRKVTPKAPSPAIIAGVVGVLALFTLPSIPRYQFAREALSQVEGKKWIHIVNETKWGDLTEPLTWFNAPVGSIFAVMPNGPIEGGFREILLRYEEQPRVTMTEPDCTDHTILRAEAAKDGVFRYTTATPDKMTSQDVSIYCDHDWRSEKDALLEEMRRQAFGKGAADMQSHQR